MSRLTTVFMSALERVIDPPATKTPYYIRSRDKKYYSEGRGFVRYSRDATVYHGQAAAWDAAEDIPDGDPEEYWLSQAL